jgi:hypothetical protein
MNFDINLRRTEFGEVFVLMRRLTLGQNLLLSSGWQHERHAVKTLNLGTNSTFAEARLNI